MKLIVVSVLVLILAVSASAEPVEVSAGPYNFSFDLKADVEPTVTTSTEEDEESTLYLVSIQLENETLATVGVTKYDEWQYAGFPCTRLKQLLVGAMNRSGEIENPSVTTRTIDGSTAEVMSYFYPETNTNSTLATYWKNSVVIEEYNIAASKDNVELISRLPYDLNENFLNTLSISSPEQTLPSGISPAGRPSDMVDSEDEDKYRACLNRWKEVGYTEAMVDFSGLCYD